MSAADCRSRNKWFVLASLFLLVNAWGVWRLSGRREVFRVSFHPGEGGTIAASEPLRWTFPAAMVEPGEIGAAPEEAPLTLRPPTPGRFVWTARDALSFAPEAPWRAGTAFVARWSPAFRAPGGAPPEPRSFVFGTAALEWSGAAQEALSPDRRATLRLDFNAPVSAGALRATLRIETSDGRPVAFEVSGGLDTARPLVTTEPVATDRIALRLPRGFAGTGGPLGLADDRAVALDLQAAVALLRLEPVSESFEPNFVRVSFTQPIDLETASAFVEIEPAVPFAVAADWHWWHGSTLRIAGGFESGRGYRITFRKGLKSTAGDALAADVSRQVFMPDRPPALAFRTAGRYLSPGGPMVVPVTAVNLRAFRVSAERVYENNVVALALRRPGRAGGGYWNRDVADLVAPPVARTFTVEASSNAPADTPVSLRDLVGDAPSGAYRLRVDADGAGAAEHLVVVTDTALLVHRSPRGLLVRALSIRTLDPVAGADVRAWSRANQELGRATTDDQGLARLALDPGDPAAAPCVVTARAGGDFAYLALDGARVARPGEDTGRDYLAEGCEAFVYTDRGVYRPGETARARAILRGPDREAPAPFPVEWRVVAPDGRVRERRAAMPGDAGACETEIALGAEDASGVYRFALGTPGSSSELGSAAVLVEDFAPPRMKLTVEAGAGRRRAGEPLEMTVRADWLFGAPAAGCPAEGRVDFVPADFAPPDWEGFVFRDAEKTFAPTRRALGEAATDASGRAAFAARADPAWRPPSALRAVLGATVREPGGRAISATAACDVDVYPFYVGLRGPGEGAAPVGEPVALDVAAVRPDGSPETGARSLAVALRRVEWTTVLRKSGDGRYEWRSERRLAPAAETRVPLEGGRGRLDVTPDAAGDYVVVARDAETGASASVPVRVSSPDQRWTAWSMEQPDRARIVPDRARYRPGDEATLVIQSPFAGRALVAIESDRVLETRSFEMTANTAEIRLPVRADYAPNVWATVTVVRPVAPGEVRASHRAVGTACLALDLPEHRLDVRLAAPEAMRPGDEAEVEIVTAGADGAPAPAEVALAAVDEAVCRLTGFETPDPVAFFCGPRRLGVEQFDVYDDLMPDVAPAAAGRPASPGGGDDAGAAAISLKGLLSPVPSRRFRPVALWVAARTGADGRARVPLRVPEFAGELRLMAVAVDRARAGSARASAKVRRPLTALASAPRFLAPGDSCRVTVQVFNETGADGEASVVIRGRGPVEVDPASALTAPVPAGRSAIVAAALRAADRPGEAAVIVETSLGAERVTETIELPVRPAAPRTAIHGSGSVAPGGRAPIDLPAGWMPGTEAARISASGLPSVTLAGGQHELLHYPYGCIEQTVSAALPLLFLPDLAAPGTVGPEEARHFAGNALLRVLSMQTADGSFAAWPGGRDGDPWSTLYALQFLTEARAAGLDVPGERWAAALDAAREILASSVASADDTTSRAWRDDMAARAWACLELARGGRADHGWMTRLIELGDAIDPSARTRLAAALLAAGRRREAVERLPVAVAAAAAPTDRRLDGPLDSPARNDALLLSLLVDVEPGHPAVPGLVRRIEDARVRGSWLTTQENAACLLALGKYARWAAANAKPFRASLAWGGRAATVTPEGPARLEAAAPVPDRADLSNEGPGTVYYAWTAEGVPAAGARPEGDWRLAARRRLLDAEGRPVDAARLRPGQLVVVEWTLDAGAERLDNVVVEDLLPAGLEVESPNLRTSRAIAWVQTRSDLPLRHVEARDDRVLGFPAAFTGTARHYYAARAVTEGRFAWPALQASAMYAPDILSRHGGATIEIRAAAEAAP